MLPQPVHRAVHRYLRLFDRFVPGRLVGLYVVGSTAYGAFVEGRSDIDLVGVLDRRPDRSELRRMRAVQLLSGAATSPPMLLRGRVNLPGTVNATFVLERDLSAPVTSIEPVATHVGHEFLVGRGFDVNPVVWQTLSSCGIAVRGSCPSELGLRPEPERLAQWNRDNLHAYWKAWAERLIASPTPRARLSPRWNTAWGVLGAPRLAFTIATGQVTTKEGAGDWALGRYDASWHPIIREGLSYWRGEPPEDDRFRDRRVRARATGEFVAHVVATA